MLEIEIFALLQEAYNLGFLESILLIKEKEKEYVKSEFYKKTKIPFLELYKIYFEYKKSNQGLIEQLNYWLENIDEGVIENKIQNLVVSLQNNETIKELMKSFSLEGLEKQQEELEKALEEVK
jgi:hypothetical protein